MNMAMYFFFKLFLDMTGKGPPIQKALDSAKADRELDPALLSAAEDEYKKLKSTTKRLEDKNKYKVIKKTMMGNHRKCRRIQRGWNWDSVPDPP